MGQRSKGVGLQYRRSDLRHLDGFATAILLSGHRLVEIETGLRLKAKGK
jgi:hypothetical protein